MSQKINNLYQFGDFRLDIAERTLMSNDEIIPLAPKVFDTLFSIIKREGDIISKEELMDEVWTDSFVEEGNLTQNIYILRQTFGKENKFIETVPRRGYRFSADLRIIEKKDDKNRNRTRIEDAEKLQINETNQESFTNSKTQQNFPRSFGGSKKPLIFSVIVFALLIGAGVWFLSVSKSPSSRDFLGNLKLQSLTDTGNLLFVSISPDGKYMACVKGYKGGEKSLWLKDLKLNQDIKLDLSSDFNLGFVKFAPDGDSIYFRNLKEVNQTSNIYKTSKFGGNAKLIAIDVWSEFDFSPDGKQISFYRKNLATNEMHLVVKNLESNIEKIHLTKSFPEGFLSTSAPIWLPNGDKIIAISRPQRRLVSQLLKIDVRNGKVEKLKTPQFRIINQVESLNSDDELIVAARERKKFPQLYKVNISDGNVTRITNDLNTYRKISLSANTNKLIALQKTTFSNIWHIPNADITKSKQITFGKLGRDGRQGLVLLPNGKVLYTSIASKNRDLWAVDLSTGSIRQLTENQGDVNDHPVLSPNSSHIYFDTSDAGTRNIHRINLDTLSTKKITSEDKSNDLFPVISPDGKQLYFIRQTKGNSAIWRKTLPNGEPIKLKLAKNAIPNRFLTISPDGKFLAFGQAAAQESMQANDVPIDTVSIAVIPTNKSESEPIFFQVSTSRPVIRWGKMSNSFDFVQQTAEGATIWRKNILDNNSPEAIVKLPNTVVYDFYWSSNNDDLIVSQGKNQDDAVLITGF